MGENASLMGYQGARTRAWTLLFIVPLLLLSSLFPLSSRMILAQDVGGDITSNTTWNVSDGPIHVTSDITVVDGVTLSIEPGARVLFDEGSGLTVKGVLIAHGVTFTSSKAKPSPGNWAGITLENAQMDSELLMDLDIRFATNGLVLDGTNTSVQGGSITASKISAIHNLNGGTATIKGVGIFSGAGTGIKCNGPITVSENNISVNVAVSLDKDCTGTFEKNILTANSTTGIDAGPGTTATVKGNLIDSKAPANSIGVLIRTGSKVNLRLNDIVGHKNGINLDSMDALVNDNSVRSYREFGVFSSVKATIAKGFWDTPKPLSGEEAPIAANAKVTIENPILSPHDLIGVPQPISLVVTNHAPFDMVKGQVLLTGKAYEPDPNSNIYGIDIRVSDVYKNVVLDWEGCNGEGDWLCVWYTEDLDDGGYTLDFRAISDGGISRPYSMVLTVNPLAQGKIEVQDGTLTTSSTITVFWSYQDISDFKAYWVYHSPDPITPTDMDSLDPMIISSPDQQNGTIAGLAPDTEYFIIVSVVTANDLVYTSNQISVWTDSKEVVQEHNVLDICIGMSLVFILIILAVIVVAAVGFYYFFVKKRKDGVEVRMVQTSSAVPSGKVACLPGSGSKTPTGAKGGSISCIIEDVFLVYRDGRLIHHDTRRLRPDVDNDMLSSMFTAIQEFIGQSFGEYDDGKSQVKEIMYGDSKILLEHGKYVYIAVVASEIKDTSALHERISRIIVSIEDRFGSELAEWEGSLQSLKGAKKMMRLVFSDGPLE